LLLKLLLAHNDYGRPSGEERALETLADIAKRQGQGGFAPGRRVSGVNWFNRTIGWFKQTP